MLPLRWRSVTCGSNRATDAAKGLRHGAHVGLSARVAPFPLGFPKASNLKLSGAACWGIKALHSQVLPPVIDGDLSSVQAELGAEFNVGLATWHAKLCCEVPCRKGTLPCCSAVQADGVAVTFGNARQAVDGPSSSSVLVDRSHWPRIRLTGRDRIPLLQKCSSQDFSRLAPGQGCDAVLLDRDGLAVDLVTALLADSHVLLLASPGRAQDVLAWVEQEAAAGEFKVAAADVSTRCSMLSLIGPESEAVLRELAGALPDALAGGSVASYACSALLNFRGTPLLVAVGCGLPFPGFTFVVDEAVAGELFSVLASKHCVLMGEHEWECVRVMAGRPMPGRELLRRAEVDSSGVNNEECATPLEAGLYHAVSLSKAIADGGGVRALADAEARGQLCQLWGLKLQAEAKRGASVMSDGDSVGTVTSHTTTPTGSHFALALIRTGGQRRFQPQEGSPVVVSGSPATLFSPAFASRCFLSDVLQPEAAPSIPGSAKGPEGRRSLVLGPGAEAMAQLASQERLRRGEEAAAEEMARQIRMREAAARLEGWRSRHLREIA